MGSTDRPGRAEHPEHSDRPISVAEQTARYEQRVAEHYSQPANRAKLDPFTTMSPGEIKRLYLPDRTDQIPPRSTSSTERPEPTGDPSRPYAVVEGNSVRLVDPAREVPSTPERGDVKPQSDRMGDRIVNEENDKASRGDRMFREGFRAAGDGIEETAKNIDSAKDALTKPSPPGYVETRPIQWVESPRRDGVDTGDAVTAATLGGMLVAYAVWQGVQNWRRRQG